MDFAMLGKMLEQFGLCAVVLGYVLYTVNKSIQENTKVLYMIKGFLQSMQAMEDDQS